MSRWMGGGLVLAMGLVWGDSPAWGQVRERDVTVTGPRGRSIERSIRSERGPGFLDRQIEIRRPGGTFERDVRIARSPAVAGPLPHVRGGGFGPVGPIGFGPRPPVFLERNVVIQQRPSLWPALAVGGGLFGLGMFAGSALASQPPPPPPPPVYAAPPVYAVPAAPPGVVYYPPQPYTPEPPPQPAAQPAAATVVVDPVADAIQRLQSHHAHSRRDGAYTLGKLRDPRAVPVLIERLKNDDEKEVRVAAATALGDIGDPRAIPFLERCTIYDKKQVVRDAAASSLARMPRPAQAPPTSLEPAEPPSVTVPNLSAPPASPPAATVPNLSGPSTPAPLENVPPPPTPAFPGESQP